MNEENIKEKLIEFWIYEEWGYEDMLSETLGMGRGDKRLYTEDELIEGYKDFRSDMVEEEWIDFIKFLTKKYDRKKNK